MEDFSFNIRDIFRILHRRKWIVILAPIVVGTLTYLTSTSPIPVYEAESLVKISHVAANMQTLLVEAMNLYQGDNIATQSRIITSRKIKAVVATRLAKKYAEFADMRSLLWDEEEGDYDALEERVRNNTKLRMLVDGLSVATEKKGVSDIVGILATALSQELAIDTANYVAEEYVNYNIAEKNSQIRQAVQFIQVTLGETKQELSEAGKKLEEFKRDHTTILSLNIGDQGNIQEQIEGLGRQIGNFQEAIEQLEAITNIEEYLTFSPPLSDMQDPLIARLEQQLWRLTDQINELKTKQRVLLSFRTEQFREVRQNVLQTEELENRAKETIGTLLRRYRAIHDELFERRRSLVQRQNQFQAVPEVIRQLESLQGDVALKTDAINLFQRRLQDAKIQRASEIKEVNVVERATTAAALFGPSRLSKVLIALMIGAMLGGVFAMILESLDTSIGTIEDVERYLKIPVLGVVPHLDEKMVKEKIPADMIGSDDPSEEISSVATLFTHFVPQEPISEAFRTIRAHLEILFKQHSWKTLMVTSSVLREGKTSTACNLAVVFAQSGQRTLLIDADLRRPHIHKVFGLSKTPGLAEVFFGVSDWERTTHSVDDIILGNWGSKNSQITPGLEYLSLLTSGRSVDNPAELLNFEKFRKILSEIRDHYDVIIVDNAPVLPVAEALQLASGVDAILLAYQIGRVGREVTKRTKDRLEAVGGNIIGLVMNDIQAEMYSTYDHEYEYYADYKATTIPSGPSWRSLSRLKERLSQFIREKLPLTWVSIRRSGRKFALLSGGLVIILGAFWWYQSRQLSSGLQVEAQEESSGEETKQAESDAEESFPGVVADVPRDVQPVKPGEEAAQDPDLPAQVTQTSQQGSVPYSSITSQTAPGQLSEDKPPPAKLTGRLESSLSDKYTIQVGAFGTEEAAQKVLSQLSAKGYSGRIEQPGRGADRYYHVWVGEFSTEHASRFQTRLKADGFQAYIKRTAGQ